MHPNEISVLCENWRPVKGYEGRYEVSDCGRVRVAITRTKNAGKLMSQFLRGSRSSYWTVTLCIGKKLKKFFVHRIMATAFFGEPEAGMQVNHKDGNKLNNLISNLEWVTSSENQRHAYRTGLKPIRRGEESGPAKLTNAEVKAIRELKDKMLVKEIAALYGVSGPSVYRILNRVTWQCVE